MLLSPNTQDTTMLMLVMMVTDYHVSPKVLVSTHTRFLLAMMRLLFVDVLAPKYVEVHTEYTVPDVMDSPKGTHSC